MRHLISGIDCAIAGAAMVAAPATPIPVTLIKSRRFIEHFLLSCDCKPSCRGLAPAWNIRFPISTTNCGAATQKDRPFQGPGFQVFRLKA
jgi:hypothetical protein